MERKEEKYYTTGEFAEYFGVKKDTLFYYDKIKLFCPAGVKENGYRFYTSSQIDLFWTLLSLRELNVPIKVLQTYFQNPSPQQLSEMASIQLSHVEAELKKLLEIKQLLKNINDAITEAQSVVLEKVTIQHLPAKYFLYGKNLKENIGTTTEQWIDAYEEFVANARLSGSTYVSSVISEKDIEQNNFIRVEKLFAESINHNGEIRENGLYAVCYHKGNYDSIPAIYPFILAEIQRLGYVVAGDSYEEYLIAETATNNPDEFVTKIVIRVLPN